MTTSNSAPAGRPRLGYILAAEYIGAGAAGVPIWSVAFHTERGETIVGRTAAAVGRDFTRERIGQCAACDYIASEAGVVFTRFGWVQP